MSYLSSCLPNFGETKMWLGTTANRLPFWFKPCYPTHPLKISSLFLELFLIVIKNDLSPILQKKVSASWLKLYLFFFLWAFRYFTFISKIFWIQVLICKLIGFFFFLTWKSLSVLYIYALDHFCFIEFHLPSIQFLFLIYSGAGMFHFWWGFRV